MIRGLASLIRLHFWRRFVHIGDYDACPCSGNHVHTTMEIGQFRIISTAQEPGAFRIRFKLEANPS